MLLVIGSVVAALIFSGCVIWYLYYFLKFNYWLWNIPGPIPVPIIGHALLFPNTSEIIPKFIELTKKYGTVIKLIVGLEPSLTITDYKIIEEILTSNKLIEKARNYRHFQNWLGDGLLISGGSKWKLRRKLITPAYHFRILDSFVNIFDRIGMNLINELEDTIKSHGEVVDVYPLVTLCTLDIICEAAMGVSMNTLTYKNSSYVMSIKEMSKIIVDKTFSPWMQFECVYKLSSTYRREMKCINVIKSHSRCIIQNRRQKGVDAESFNTFLDILLHSDLDENEIQDEVETFMFEGHDTTASAVSFTLYLISHHPEVKQKILEEQQHLASDFSLSGTKLLNEMKYLEMVIKESLRLFPSVPFYCRRTTEPIKLDNGLLLPAGLLINIFAYGIHRSETLYTNPNQFYPERFADQKTCPFAFIPFSAGPRNCIGQKFAMLEMKALISKIVRNFDVMPVEGFELELVAETILKSRNGVKVRFVKR